MRRRLRPPRTRRALLGVLLVLGAAVILSASHDAFARPGSGQSFSGSSKSGSSNSGGSSSGGGDLIFFLIQICFEFPAIGIPLLVVVLIVVAVMKMKSKGSEWSTQSAARTWTPPPVAAPPTRPSSLRKKLASALRANDPAFSLVVFEDFVYLLYAEVQRGRGPGKAELLTPYVDERVRASLRGDGRIQDVHGIIIGSMEYESVDVLGDRANVSLLLDVNYVERYQGGQEARFYAKERLRVARLLSARSRTPDQTSMLACPNCGAPLSSMRGATCSHCNTIITPGQKDWAVVGLEVLERETRGPMLTSGVEEVGTDYPTLYDPEARSSMERLQRKDPAFAWPLFEQRVRHIFAELQTGWTAREPLKVRPFMSDSLFQSQVYFLEAYKAARAINRLDQTAVERIELVNVASDAYYDAITVRLFATGLDYTVSEDGRVLSGNPKRPRRYSEYWTLIRGARGNTAPKDDRNCPNCGAPLNVSMVGNCTYCRVKVTSGEFNWVLSRIEQDEAYRG